MELARVRVEEVTRIGPELEELDARNQLLEQAFEQEKLR